MKRLQVKLQAHQLEAYKLLNHTNFDVKEILFGGAKGGGKSFLGCTWILSQAICFPETFYFVARAELNDLRKYTLQSFIEAVQKLGLPRETLTFNGQDNYISLPNKSKIYFIACKHLPSDPLFERFGSLQFTAAWIEEAGEIEHIEAYENLKKTTGRWKNLEYNLPAKLLITCNPKKNWLYSQFYMPFKKNELPKDKAFIMALPTDNSFLPDSYIKSLESGTKRDIQRLRYGIWDYDDSDNALISFEKINDIFTNTHVEPTGNRFISADIGIVNDYFCAYVWDGLKVIDYYAAKKMEGNVIISKLNELKNIHKIPNSNIIIDADGQGRVLMGDLPGAIKFNANAQSFEVEYRNLKAWSHYRLSREINAGNIHIACSMYPEHKEMLITDLQMIKRSTDGDEKLNVVSKKDIKEILDRSPDFSDALSFRVFFLHTRRK